MTQLSPEEQRKQIMYRDARRSGQYDNIWQSVGKCVFCDIRQKYVFHEENGMVMTISLYAYIDGQFMIIPRRHIRSVKELTRLEWETVRKLMYVAKKLIREVHGIKGVQFLLRDGGIEAQSTVDQHFHLQCIPFDAPDLSVWNYRQLKHTPIENAELYQQARKKIIKHSAKFAEKYDKQSALLVHCDAIITNSLGEILFMKRARGAKLEQDYITQPGGRVENFDASLEKELSREVNEETGLQLKSSDFALVNSQIDHVTYKDTPTITFLRNTYQLRTSLDKPKLTAGDDCEQLLWLPLKKVLSHPNISPETKIIMQKVLG